MTRTVPVLLFHQGSQAIRVGTADIKMYVGGNQRLYIADTSVAFGGVNNRILEISYDAKDLCYLDFHSQDARAVDYDTRIGSVGGSASSQQGQLQYLAKTHFFEGSVGLGTSSPASGERLTVIGSIGCYGASSNLNIGHSSDSSGITVVGNNTAWFNSYCSVSAANGNTIVRNSLNSYFRTRDSDVNLGACIQLLDVSTNADYPTAVRGGAICFATMNGGTGFANNPALERMRITPDGRVGIGIEDPSAKLHVATNSTEPVYEWHGTYTGQTVNNYLLKVAANIAASNANGNALAQAASIQLKAQDLSWAGGSIYLPGAELIIEGGKSVNAAQTGASMIFKTWNTQRMIITPNGFVGIGTYPSDSYLLDISGSANAIRLHNDDSREGAYLNLNFCHSKTSPNRNSYIQSYLWGDGSTFMKFYVSNTVSNYQRMQLDSEGNVWIAGTLSQSSDITLKKNIEPLPEVLPTLLTLSPKSYHLQTQDDSEPKHFGLIAQDVQQLLPNLVGQTEGRLTLSYIELVPLLIKGMQEQQQTIVSLTDRLSRLEALLSKMV